MTQRAVIVGASAIGHRIASRIQSTHQVLLLDTDENAFSGVAAPLAPKESLDALAGRPGCRFVRADGTSRLVLSSLFTEQAPCALMATTGIHQVNLEICRLGKEIGFEPVLALTHQQDDAEEFDDLGSVAIDVSGLVAEQLDRSLRFSGAVLPIGMGLGKGELMEIRLVRTSPILHRPLKDLAPHRWRVAAVFRADELIVPTGTTILKQDDRVLLVGDPKILPTVSEYLRLGTPQFPKQFGPNIVTLEWQGADEALAREARTLLRTSHASELLRGIKPTTASESEPSPADAAEQPEVTFTPPLLSQDNFASKLKSRQPGIVMCRSMRRTLAERLLQKRGKDTQLCDRCGCPVLFSRGRESYKRILLPVSDSDLNIRAAETAIDLSRQFGISLLAVNVDLPSHISGLAQEQLHHEVEPIRRLCQLYDVVLDYHHHDGNPISSILREADADDLMVTARRFGRADTYFNPDIALRIARTAPCSVLVLTVTHD